MLPVTVNDQHAGNDGVHRPLARGDAVGVGRIHVERAAPVLQDHPATGPDQAAAEGMEQRVDETDGVAVTIDDAEIDRIGVRRHTDRQEFGQRLKNIQLLRSFQTGTITL